MPSGSWAQCLQEQGRAPGAGCTPPHLLCDWGVGASCVLYLPGSQVWGVGSTGPGHRPQAPWAVLLPHPVRVIASLGPCTRGRNSASPRASPRQPCCCRPCPACEAWPRGFPRRRKGVECRWFPAEAQLGRGESSPIGEGRRARGPVRAGSALGPGPRPLPALPSLPLRGSRTGSAGRVSARSPFEQNQGERAPRAARGRERPRARAGPPGGSLFPRCRLAGSERRPLSRRPRGSGQRGCARSAPPGPEAFPGPTKWGCGAGRTRPAAMTGSNPAGAPRPGQ